MGVRIFEKAEQPNTGASLALPRRKARGVRRRLRRKRLRKERIKELLQETGCIDRKELDALLAASGFEKDVYTLRAEGLDRRLAQEEWVRVLLHLAQRLRSLGLEDAMIKALLPLSFSKAGRLSDL